MRTNLDEHLLRVGWATPAAAPTTPIRARRFHLLGDSDSVDEGNSRASDEDVAISPQAGPGRENASPHAAATANRAHGSAAREATRSALAPTAASAANATSPGLGPASEDDAPSTAAACLSAGAGAGLALISPSARMHAARGTGGVFHRCGTSAASSHAAGKQLHAQQLAQLQQGFSYGPRAHSLAQAGLQLVVTSSAAAPGAASVTGDAASADTPAYGGAGWTQADVAAAANMSGVAPLPGDECSRGALARPLLNTLTGLPPATPIRRRGWGDGGTTSGITALTATTVREADAVRLGHATPSRGGGGGGVWFGVSPIPRERVPPAVPTSPPVAVAGSTGTAATATGGAGSAAAVVVVSPSGRRRRRVAVFGHLPTEFNSPEQAERVWGRDAVCAEERRRVAAAVASAAAGLPLDMWSPMRPSTMHLSSPSTAVALAIRHSDAAAAAAGHCYDSDSDDNDVAPAARATRARDALHRQGSLAAMHMGAARPIASPLLQSAAASPASGDDEDSIDGGRAAAAPVDDNEVRGNGLGEHAHTVGTGADGQWSHAGCSTGRLQSPGAKRRSPYRVDDGAAHSDASGSTSLIVAGCSGSQPCPRRRSHGNGSGSPSRCRDDERESGGERTEELDAGGCSGPRKRSPAKVHTPTAHAAARVPHEPAAASAARTGYVLASTPVAAAEAPTTAAPPKGLSAQQRWKLVQTLTREVFGHTGGLRPAQSQAVGAALAGRDALVLLPTGSGKSLCYILPALAVAGVTVVVSPLVALVADQMQW
jgi:hypothetical protein